ncbi:MAG: 4a-hydroxytetrahydrobiopterin dehydratase [Puniceicoccaceae bacterium]|nr:MAG: 4a-hydroxytetrahydrobiopterin dehydratase [Puniceicoccaceae bacterium]
MSQPLSPHQIEEALAGLPGWKVEADALVKSFKFNHFAEALSFIVRLGIECERHDHHPHLTNVWNKVELRFNTHDAGGKITAKDVKMAEAVEHFNWLKS